MADQGTATASEAGALWLSDDETSAWVGLLAILLKLPGLLDGQLQRDCGIGTFDYVVLSSLSMSHGRMLRMSALAELANGSLSRLSNVVKRLEQQGWIRREPDPTDRRYTVAQLTDAGWEQVVAAAPGHVRAVRNFVLDPLSPTQIRQLADIGSKIRSHLGTEARGDSPCTESTESVAPCAGPDCQ
jgi:DNA-binding MarR family transcriptional regulator